MVKRLLWLPGLLWAAAALFAAPVPAQDAKPNIVFIYSDDHHYQTLGAAGNPHIRTPNLDRLASRGVYFTNGIASTPQCAPSRGVMLTGLESYQSGLESNGRLAFRDGTGPTVVEQIRGAGYDTVLLGKWHIEPQPQACGFVKAPLWLRGGASPYREPLLLRGFGAPAERVSGHITDLLTDAAVDYIATAKRPFLLWLAYNAPHTPWYADERFLAPYAGRNDTIAPPAHPRGGPPFDWATYYAVITHLDEAVGRVVSAIEKSGRWQNTLIVFLGDNGYLCGTKGLQGKVEPWEESIRVPYFASGGIVRARAKIDAPVASVDLPATFLDYAGVRAARPLAGTSLRRELETGQSKRRAAFAVWNDGRPEALAVRRSVEPYRVVRTRAHKYILWQSGREALFDLSSDPGEERSLASDSARASLRRELREHLVRRMRNTADPALAWLSSQRSATNR